MQGHLPEIALFSTELYNDKESAEDGSEEFPASPVRACDSHAT
jgi:hypothetical protein